MKWPFSPPSCHVFLHLSYPPPPFLFYVTGKTVTRFFWESTSSSAPPRLSLKYFFCLSPLHPCAVTQCFCTVGACNLWRGFPASLFRLKSLQSSIATWIWKTSTLLFSGLSGCKKRLFSCFLLFIYGPGCTLPLHLTLVCLDLNRSCNSDILYCLCFSFM